MTPGYGFAFRLCRAAMGLTKGQLAKRVGLSASHVSLIEAGKRQPSVDVLDRAAKALHIHPHLLIALAYGAVDDVAVPLFHWLITADRTR